MGRDRIESGISGFRRPNNSNSAHNVADWGIVNPGKLISLIECASKKGGAVRFGYTRDGGAYAIGVYCGEDYFTDYVRPSEDIDLYIETLKESFIEWQPTETPAPKKRGGKS